MSFFDEQAKAQRKTTLLIFYFIVAVLLTILTIDGLIIAAITYANQETFTYSHMPGFVLRHENFDPMMIQVLIFVSPVVLGVILLGTLITSFQLRGGGLSVAKMVNARPIDPNTSDPTERRFINVVTEMSIASRVPLPQLYVMDSENSINAFVSGLKQDDTVMVVSKGALDKLSRDEMQGVVGHEFSHIYHSDMKISIYLMGLTAGLLLVGKIGHFALRAAFYSRNDRSSRADPRLQLAVWIFGIGLVIVGAIGLLFGRLMKAAVSRQRELLADASSVAYTRNPIGLVFALRRIQDDQDHSFLKSVNAEDVSHICFCPALRSLMLSAFATHPPIPLRIERLDPNGEYAQMPLPNVTKT